MGGGNVGVLFLSKARVRLVLGGWLAVLASLVLAERAEAQRRPAQKPFEFQFFPADGEAFDPAKFLEDFFGGAARGLEDAEALDKVAVSVQEEQRLGRQVLDELKRRLAARHASLTDRGKDVQYLQRLVAEIQPQMRQAERYRRVNVYVSDLAEPEAYALPGGHLMVSRGMIEGSPCEAGLVCVLGHELAHLDRGHLLKRMKQWKLAQQRMEQMRGGPNFAQFQDSMNAMMQLFRRPFGPAEELEADTDGITWAYAAGYDPRAVHEVYVALEKAGKAPAAGMPAFLRTHPLTAERRENLRTTYAELQAAEPKPELYLGRENLRLRLTRGQREFAE